VQVEVVGHDCGAEDGDAGHEHFGIADEVRRREQAEGELAQIWLGPKDFQREATADDQNEHRDQRLHVAEAAMLEKRARRKRRGPVRQTPMVSGRMKRAI